MYHGCAKMQKNKEKKRKTDTFQRSQGRGAFPAWVEHKLTPETSTIYSDAT